MPSDDPCIVTDQEIPSVDAAIAYPPCWSLKHRWPPEPAVTSGSERHSRAEFSTPGQSQTESRLVRRQDTDHSAGREASWLSRVSEDMLQAAHLPARELGKWLLPQLQSLVRVHPVRGCALQQRAERAWRHGRPQRPPRGRGGGSGARWPVLLDERVKACGRRPRAPDARGTPMRQEPRGRRALDRNGACGSVGVRVDYCGVRCRRP